MKRRVLVSLARHPVDACAQREKSVEDVELFSNVQPQRCDGGFRAGHGSTACNFSTNLNPESVGRTQPRHWGFSSMRLARRRRFFAKS